MQPAAHGFGRIVEPDPRDGLFPMRTILPGVWPRKRRIRWTLGPVLDQGPTGSCVGHAAKAWVMATPRPSGAARPPGAFDIYNLARQLDDDPYNDNMDTGTSIRGGMQALQLLGRAKSYVWASSVDEMARWVLTRGGLIIGVAWFDKMDIPDGRGQIHVSGRFLGGHAVFLYGTDRDDELFFGVNSWGSGWGLGGRFSLSYDDMDRLLRDDGEAVTATEYPVAPIGEGDR
jgi:hypothetical protein